MAIHNDVAWFRGEDILLTFTMTPTVDITGWTISCRVKAALSDTSPLLTIAGALLTPASGIFTVAVTAAQDTATLQSGQYPYSVVRTDGGSVAVLSEGVLIIKPSTYLA